MQTQTQKEVAVFKESHLKAFGSKYFVANAPLVSIGSYGEKATPVFGQNKLEVKDHVPAPKLDGKIKKVAAISLDSVTSSKTDFVSSVSGNILVVGFDGSTSDVYEGLAKEHLKLVWFAIEPNDMMDAANKSPQVLADLKKYGADARIAHEIFVIMEASWASSFSGASRFDLSADAAGIVSVAASGGTSVASKSTVKLSSGTTLAYLLLKLDWNKDKTHINDIDADEWGMS
jgi:hypothetical protein